MPTHHSDRSALQEELEAMQATKERFFVFIEKLKEKLLEFAQAALSEFKDMDESYEAEQSNHRMKAAVLGQLQSVLKKAEEVKEEKITYFPYSNHDWEVSKAYLQFRNECYDKSRELDSLCQVYSNKIEQSFIKDHEAEYQKILEEHERIKNSFKCTQCGSLISIPEIYFTTTYITCEACQTKNTFEPSSQAKTLDDLGRTLAEQRTRHLKQKFEQIPVKAHQFYIEAHHIELSLIHEKDTKVIELKKKQITELKQQKADLEASAPKYYEQYLRAMFDEWNKISPALKEEHEKFHDRLLNDYYKRIKD